MSDWQPGSSLQLLKARAAMLDSIRQFFRAHEVLEVETPLLARAPGTDVYIDALSTRLQHSSTPLQLYLQTSPEFAMKRLLAAGSGPIFQICKAFRDDPPGRMHNPEFTMLEWYRPQFGLEEMIAELAALIRQLMPCDDIPLFTYHQLFLDILDINPHTAAPDAILSLAHNKLDLVGADLGTVDCLQQLMAHCIEPQLPKICIIYDYPVDQAALAEIGDDASGHQVARRFELYINSVEIANGYQELTDPTEQRARFEKDLAVRKTQGLEIYPLDEKFLQALAEIPPCSGVAVGLDRLLMQMTNIKDIDAALSFGIKRC